MVEKLKRKEKKLEEIKAEIAKKKLQRKQRILKETTEK
jgi:hypothetical protein